MRTTLLGVFLLLIAAGGCPDGGADTPDGGAPERDQRARGLEAETGRRDGPVAKTVTTVRVHYPAAGKKITIRGSAGPLSWSQGQPMQAGASDVWTYGTEAITTAVEWKPLLDDTTWSRGPNYRVDPGQTLDVYPHFTIKSGQVSKLFASFQSTLLGNQRIVWAYLPPTYLENTLAKLPVVYMHDGQNLFDPLLAFGGNEWKVDEAMDAIAETGNAREAIVIGIENAGAARIAEYTPTADSSYPSSGKGDLYLRMIIEELKPKVDAQLRTRTEREHTAIVGSSLGGLISAYAGVRRPDYFGLVGALSPSTWWDNRVIITEVKSIAQKSQRASRVYVDSGDSGPSSDDVVNTKELAQAYVSVGYVAQKSFLHVVGTGHQHSEVYWALRFPSAIAFLLGPRQ